MTPNPKPVNVNGPSWTKLHDKPKSLTQALRSLLAYMKPERRSLILGLTITLCGTILALIGPQFIEMITDAISESILGDRDLDLGWIAKVGALLVAIYGSSLICGTVQAYIIGSASEKVGDRMRKDLNDKFYRLPFSYLENHQVGDLMSRVTNDTDTVRKGSVDIFNSTINTVVTIIGAVVMMFYTSSSLAVFAVLPTMIGLLGLYIVTQRTQRFFVAQQRDLGLINGVVEEAYYGHDILKVYNNWGVAHAEFDEINRSLFNTSFKARVITGMMPQLMNFISNLAYVIVCVVGSILIIEGRIEYGVIAAFIVYVRLFNNPIAELADTLARMQSVASASERVFHFLNEEEMTPDPKLEGFVRAKGDISFKDVRFGYRPDVEIIHGINLEVKAGSTIAIVGPTGAGKTTMVNLLMRFYDPTSGTIEIDGIPTVSLSRAQVRDQFSMVLQDSWVFDGTVYENIAMTSKEADIETVREACRTVGIDEYIMSLPDGYDTVLTENAGLSVGQKQQLAIARAIVKDAPMIILDEATSSVDTRTEKRIQQAMDGMTRGKTAFVIAHRLSTIRNADRILVMVGGEVVESGTHKELIELGGIYKTLNDAQFEESD